MSSTLGEHTRLTTSATHEHELIRACWLPSLRYSHNGERLGTYNGHNGTIWSIAVDSKSEFLLSASADNTMKLWAVATGKCLYTWEFPTAVKRVAWKSVHRHEHQRGRKGRESWASSTGKRES